METGEERRVKSVFLVFLYMQRFFALMTLYDADYKILSS